MSDNLEALQAAMAGPFDPTCVSHCWVSVEEEKVGLAAGDYVAGPEWISPGDARKLAAALIAAAEWAEAQL